MLKLCKKATGMVLSFILVLELVFCGIKRANTKMVIDSHRFLCSKDSIFSNKRVSCVISLQYLSTKGGKEIFLMTYGCLFREG